MNVALVASGRWHKQASLINALASVKDRITMEIITQVMDPLKVSQNDFANACKDRALISYVQRSYAEGIKNMVSVTPTFFISGHRYRCCKDIRWVVDAIEYRNHCDHSQIPSH
jgi:protein-disulfide isomerase